MHPRKWLLAGLTTTAALPAGTDLRVWPSGPGRMVASYRSGGGRPVVDEGAGCTVTVCRDCCCGSTTKHPQVDHDAQLVQLRTGLTAPHRVRTSLCLDVCAQANVVVVHPNPAARRAGARPVWFGLIGDPTIVGDLTTWVDAGGPGVAPLPPILELSVIAPPAG